MSEIASRIPEDLKTAMKAKDTVALNVLRALKTSLTNASIEKGGLGTPLDDAEVQAIVRKQIKQRRDSIEQFENAGRAELANNEKAEIIILERYLPAALSAGEVAALIDEVIAETGAAGKADFGKAMKLLQEKAAGRAEGKTLSSELQKRLS